VYQDPYVRIRVEGDTVVVKDQIKEYVDRGVALADMNVYDYYLETYHGAMLKSAAEESEGGSDTGEDDEEPDVVRTAGRPASRRVPYLAQSKRKGCRIFRGAKYEAVLQFIGTWFPCSNSGDSYFASILMLLKPWRQLDDLTTGFSTFELAFQDMMTKGGHKYRRIVQNIAFFHECSDSSKKRKDEELRHAAGVVDLNDFVARDAELEELNTMQTELSESDIEVARNNRYPAREFLYGQHTMNVARSVGFFDDDGLQSNEALAERATEADWLKYEEWGRKVSSMT
jgi:hypothetical protein